MKNFNSILSILLPGLVKYNNVVNKIYTNVDTTLKNYAGNKHIEYNNNSLVILDKLKQIEKYQETYQEKPPNTDEIETILHMLNDIYDIKNLININFEIVTLKFILHTIKNEFSETKTNTIDKKILESTNVLNNISNCEYSFINELVYLFVDYFDKNNKYIDSILTYQHSGINGYINNIIIGIISFYKYNKEYYDRNNKVVDFLYKSIYKSICSKTNTCSRDYDIWYIPNKLSRENGVIYKLKNLLTAQIPALHVVNGISNNIVTQFNTIVITPTTESKYKIIKNYSNIYFRNYLRDELMNTGNIKFKDIELVIKKYSEWVKETSDNTLLQNTLIQILAKNFNDLLPEKIQSFSEFTILISGFDSSKSNILTMVYNTYIIQSFSDFYLESINRLIASQFVSGHTNALFDNQVACDNNFMKEAYISNLINIKTSAMSLQKKILDAVNTKFKSEIYSILSYNHKNSRDALLTLFKSIIKSIIDPGKNVKSKFIEKLNILIPKTSLKHFIMKNPSTVFELNI